MSAENAPNEKSGAFLLAALFWTVAGVAFVVLFVLDASRWTWLGSLAAALAIVVILGSIRWLLLDVERSRRSWEMIVLGTILPPVGRFLEEMERRVKTIRDNEAVVANMGYTLGAYALGDLPPAVSETLRWKPGGYSAPEELDVVTCAGEIARAMSTEKGRPFRLDAGEQVLGELLVILYCDRYRDAGNDATQENLWSERKGVLARHLATVLLRREELEHSGVGAAELADFLASRDRFALADVHRYVQTRPVTVSDRMEQVVELYRPVPDHRAEQGWPVIDKAELNRRVARQKQANKRIGTAAGYCASATTGQNPPSAELFELLYLVRFKPTAAITYWHARTEGLVPELARVLAYSDRLPSSAADFSRNPGLLGRLLASMRDYTLAAVHEEVVGLQRLLKRARRFADFLSGEGVEHDVAVEPERLLDWLEPLTHDGLASGAQDWSWLRDPEVSNDVLARVGELALSRSHASLDPRDVVDLALVLVGEFLVRTNAGPAGAEAAVARRAASASSSARVLFGLLRLRGRSEGTPVKLSRLLDELPALAEEAKRDPTQVYRVTLQLRSGAWPTDSAPPVPQGPTDREALVEDVVQALAAELSPDLGHLERELSTLRRHVEDVEHFEWQRVRPELAQLQQQVERLATREGIARLRDMLIGVTGAEPSDLDRYYLITYDSHTGPLSMLLDALAKMSAPLQEHLEACGAERDDAEAVKRVIKRAQTGAYYRFGHYTRYARIGRLPYDRDFDEFARTFFDDLECLLRVTDGQADFREPEDTIRWDGVEVTILSLGRPVRYDFRPDSLKRMLRETRSVEEDALERRVGSEAVKPLKQHSSVDETRDLSRQP